MKILIWGTGHNANNFIATSGIKEEEILGYIESQKSQETFRNKAVYYPAEIKNLNYDIIIVASSYVEEIKSEIEKCGINSEKVIFLSLTKVGVLDENIDGIEKYDFFGIQNCKTWIYWADAVFSNSKDVLSRITNDLDMSKYWKDKEVYAPSVEISEIAGHQKEFLNKYFFPQLKKDQTICDFACASGEWSELVSPYVGHIDGFDCSEKMLASAAKHAEMKGINNISYQYMDATQLKFERKYDHFMMFGLLTCIDEEQVVEHIVKTVSESIETEGYLVIRDTLNMSESENVYYNRFWGGNYTAVYHPKEAYERIFERNGLEILQEEYFKSYHHQPIEVGSHGYILRKK